MDEDASASQPGPMDEVVGLDEELAQVLARRVARHDAQVRQALGGRNGRILFNLIKIIAVMDSEL